MRSPQNKWKHKRMVSNAVCKRRVAKLNRILKPLLTNHTNAATFIKPNSLFNRCRKLASEKTCFKTRQSPMLMMHCLTYRHLWNNLHVERTQHKKNENTTQMVSCIVRERREKGRNKIWKISYQSVTNRYVCNDYRLSMHFKILVSQIDSPRTKWDQR